MPIKKIEEHIKKYTDLVNNLKRNPNKSYRRCRITEILKKLETDYEDVLKILDLFSDEVYQKTLLLKVRQVHVEAKY